MIILKKFLFSLLFLYVLTYNYEYVYADDYAYKLDELMNKYDRMEIFSGVVLLAKDGSPVYEKAFGYADWENKIPNNTKTLFNIGSLNKLFTHSIILQLQNEGKLNVNDTLNKYLSIYPDTIGSKITIEMLLEMKAGLGDYLEDPAYNKNVEKFRTVDDYLELIKHEPLLFEPGTDKRYSNSGFAVLGGVIEKTTGKSYTENLKERFFIPLGMNDTYYRQIGDILSNVAIGTELTFSGKKINRPFQTSPSPAGGLFTNAEDLLKFDRELRKTNIMGSLVARAGGTPLWSAVLIQMNDGYTLIVLSNFRLISEEIAKRFRDIIQGKQYAEPELPLEMKFYKILKDSGSDELGKQLKDVLEANHLEYNDMQLNMFGYSLMQEGEIDMAIEVFKLNAKLFPNVPNVYDSLGEAYMNKGNKDLAITNYQKVLDLEPDNKNAKKMLEKLKGK